MDRKLLTVSIEGNQISLLSAKGRRIQKWHQFDIPDGAVQSGVLTDPLEVGARLREAVQQNEFPAGRTVASISGQRSIFRTLLFPEIDQDLLDATVRRKVRQEIPLPESDADLSWTIVERQNGQTKVFVVMTPRTIIDSHVRAIQEAGLKLKDLDSGPLALVRAANAADAIVVSLEPSGLSVLVVQGTIPAIVRTVPLNQTLVSAEAHAELLVQELNRTAKFFNESRRESPLRPETEVIALGSYFSQPGALTRLKQMSPYPVRLPAPPVQTPEDFPLPVYGVNIGLVLKSLS